MNAEQQGLAEWTERFGDGSQRASYRDITDAGLETCSEIVDADPPHEPRGCVAHARSVGELLRARSEDLSEGEG